MSLSLWCLHKNGVNLHRRVMLFPKVIGWKVKSPVSILGYLPSSGCEGCQRPPKQYRLLSLFLVAHQNFMVKQIHILPKCIEQMSTDCPQMGNPALSGSETVVEKELSKSVRAIIGEDYWKNNFWAWIHELTIGISAQDLNRIKPYNIPGWTGEKFMSLNS